VSGFAYAFRGQLAEHLRERATMLDVVRYGLSGFLAAMRARVRWDQTDRAHFLGPFLVVFGPFLVVLRGARTACRNGTATDEPFHV
jgi:hypothetical protein